MMVFRFFDGSVKYPRNVGHGNSLSAMVPILSLNRLELKRCITFPSETNTASQRRHLKQPQWNFKYNLFKMIDRSGEEGGGGRQGEKGERR